MQQPSTPFVRRAIPEHAHVCLTQAALFPSIPRLTSHFSLDRDHMPRDTYTFCAARSPAHFRVFRDFMASFAPLVHHLCPRCASGERNLDGDVDGDLAESVSVAASMGAARARISKPLPTLADSARISLSMDHMVQTSAQWDTLIETSFRMLAAAQVRCAFGPPCTFTSPLLFFSTKHVVKTLHRYCGAALTQHLSPPVCAVPYRSRSRLVRASL